MELKMNEYQLPEIIKFNYEELKQELTQRVTTYETMVYTDEQIKEAKVDKANLNKLKKALNDERIRREKEYLEPFNDFKSKINEIISIIDKPVAIIDKQVKEYEDKQKQEKALKIDEILKEAENSIPEDVHIPFNEKWLNASTSMKAITAEIELKVQQIKTDLDTIRLLPEFSFEAEQIYISTLDMNKAVNEAHRMSEMAKKKAEHQAEQARLKAEADATTAMNPPVEDVDVSKVENTTAPSQEDLKPVQWVSFKALLTVDQAKELKEFFDLRQIEFKAV